MLNKRATGDQDESKKSGSKENKATGIDDAQTASPRLLFFPSKFF